MSTISADANLSALDPYDRFGTSWVLPAVAAGIPTGTPISLSADSVWKIIANLKDKTGVGGPSPGYDIFECDKGQWTRSFSRPNSGPSSFGPWVQTLNFQTGVSAGVTSVNGMTGDVSISASVVLPVTLAVSGT